MVNFTVQQQQEFCNFFIEKYLSNGFGAMTKSELDILIFHLLNTSADIKGKSNYEIANKLLIPESKVKSLRLNAALKYEQANHKAVLANIVLRITRKMQMPEFDSGEVTITLENPVEQRELEHAIKSAGRNIEYGLNRELFKIKPIALFELVASFFENRDDEFKIIIQANIQDTQKQASIVNNALTFRQRVNKVGEEINDKASLIGLLGGLGGAL